MTAATFDARVAVNAPPLLAAFNRAGVISSADVHVAQRLGRLTQEGDERVLLAVALAVRAVRTGSVCVALDDLDALALPEAEDAVPVPVPDWPPPDAWRTAIEASPLVAVGVNGPGDRPIRWATGRLYLDRYWRHEQVVRHAVNSRLAAPPFTIDPDRLAAALRRFFPRPGDTHQRLAAATTALSRITVLTGGPGTGKTTTIAHVLAVLQAVAGPSLRIALAAPTGKAAARLEQAVAAELATLAARDQVRVVVPAATTVHRLLGWRPGTTTRFRHDHSHHLPHDLVVIDETSMVSLPLMARLLEALRPDARLLLVGDPDQLASVEAGAVLGDLVARPPVADHLPAALAAVLPDYLPTGPAARTALRNGVVRLETVHRHGQVIAALAAAIRQGRPDDALAVLRAGDPAVSFVETAAEWPTEADLATVRRDAETAGGALGDAARDGDIPAALQALESHRLLLAHRRGPAGVARWAAQVEAWVAAIRPGIGPDAGPWYPGRPLLVTTNDRDTGLFNGDTGVIVADGTGGVVAAFGDPGREHIVPVHRLPAVESVHAMTVHRGQGSQFSRICLLLPPATSPLLTRELLYTAVTRARGSVLVLGTEPAVRAAINRPVRRASGLRSH